MDRFFWPKIWAFIKSFLLLQSLQSCNHYKKKMNATPDTRAYLNEYGIRPSVQRIAVMNYLLHHRTHPTAEEIYQALAPEMPTLSRTTVYNTLELLVARGAVIHLTIDPRFSRYDGDISLHGHFLCDHCGTLYDVPLKTLPEALYPKEHRVNSAQRYYRGTCAHC